MIQILGVRRILFLILLVSANAALAATTYLYVMPEKDQVVRQLNMTRSQISEKRTEADRLRTEFAQIQQQKARFEAMQAAGLTSDQNRLVARRRIMDIQNYSRVLKASYNINSASVEQSEAARQIGHVILNSPIRVEIDAMDDKDFYSFIHLMENAFPGHTAIKNIKIERVLDVNEATLRAVGSGMPVVLIKGNVDFIWRTMVPEAQIQTGQNFGSEGF